MSCALELKSTYLKLIISSRDSIYRRIHSEKLVEGNGHQINPLSGGNFVIPAAVARMERLSILPFSQCSAELIQQW